MRKILFSIALCSSLFIISCQKPNEDTPDLLVKTFYKSGSDSLVTLYTYNFSGKLENEKISGYINGSTYSEEKQIYRNNAGIITRLETIYGGNSTSITVHYDATSSRYFSMAPGYDNSGVRDSTVFIYDAAGRTIRKDIYRDIYNCCNYLSVRHEYAYDAAGNLAQRKLYTIQFPSGVANLISTASFTSFDDKINPYKTDHEAFVIDRPDWISPNNVTAMDGQFVNDPASNYTFNFAYTYNSNNFPIALVRTSVPPGIVGNVTFYYQ